MVGGTSLPKDADLICRVQLTSATPPGRRLQCHGIDLEIMMQFIRRFIKSALTQVAPCHSRLYVSERRWTVAITVGRVPGHEEVVSIKGLLLRRRSLPPDCN